jgi:hypothetical protein
MVLQSIPVLRLGKGSPEALSPRPRARGYAMAMMKIFLAEDGFIDSLSERAPFSVSV